MKRSAERLAVAILMIVSVLIPAMVVRAEPVDLWATTAGGTGRDNAYAVAPLDDGGSMVTGGYSGSVAFGSTTLVSTGNRDVYVVKIDADGNWQWAASAGTTGQGDIARAITVLADGSAIVTGYFRGTMIFAGSSVPNLVSVGQEDVFVAKIDASGTWVWATKAGSTSVDGTQGPDVGRAIVALSDGSAVVTGYFQGSATFGSLAPVVSSGERDVFVARIDPDGAWQWVSSAGGTGVDAGLGLAVLPGDDVIVTGDFTGSIEFGALGPMTSIGGSDVFVARVSSAGVWAWQTSAGGTGDDSGTAIAAHVDGAIGVAGSFSGSATFGAAGSVDATGLSDMFAAQLDDSGSWEWVTGAGDSSDDWATAMLATSNGRYLVSGSFQGTAIFGSTTLVSAGVEDGFLTEIDRPGGFLWAQRGGGTDFEDFRGIAELPDGSVVVVGDFEGTAVFGSTTLVSLGSVEGFVARSAVSPDAPTGVTAAIMSDSLVVSWEPPLRDGGSAVTSYRVTVQPGAMTCEVPATIRTCSFSRLQAGVAYTATVVAENDAGVGAESARTEPVSIMAPAFTG